MHELYTVSECLERVANVLTGVAALAEGIERCEPSQQNQYALAIGGAADCAADAVKFGLERLAVATEAAMAMLDESGSKAPATTAKLNHDEAALLGDYRKLRAPERKGVASGLRSVVYPRAK